MSAAISRQEVGKTFLNTQVFVSVGAVRQISVAVLGEANEPGIYRMGGLANVLDALAMAGGIKKTGSLRHISLVRGDRTSIIDLYPVMTDVRGAASLALADGDRIMIPPIGPTVAVSNEVVRPAIYELIGNGQIDGPQLLNLAGGPLRPSGNRFVRLSLDAVGRDVTTEEPSIARLGFRSGDILMVLRREDLPVGSVRLDGNVRVPGVRSLAAAPDVRSLIGSSDTFLDDPYLIFGAIQTTDDETRAHRLIPINLASVMNGTERVPLKDGDVVIVLSVGDVNYLASADVQAVLEGKRPPVLFERIVTQNPRSSESTPTGPQRAEEGAQPSNLIGEAPRGASPNAAPPVPVAPTAAPGASPGSTAALISGQNQASQNAEPNSGTAPPPFDRENLAQQSLQICRGLQELATIAQNARPGRFSSAIYSVAPGSRSNAETRIENVFRCPPIFDKYPELLPLLVDHAATIDGEVRIPGPYPILPTTPLSAIVDEAGGLARDRRKIPRRGGARAHELPEREIQIAVLERPAVVLRARIVGQ